MRRPKGFRSLRNLLFGGDVASVEAIERVLAHKPERLLNGYGPTETTTFASSYLIVRAPLSSAPIGLNRECSDLRAGWLRRARSAGSGG